MVADLWTDVEDNDLLGRRTEAECCTICREKFERFTATLLAVSGAARRPPWLQTILAMHPPGKKCRGKYLILFPAGPEHTLAPS